MRAIFISYRRDDSEGQAGRLYDDLSRTFGDSSVFMDVTAIEPGLDFRKVIDHNVASCGVLLAVIGPGWLDAKDETGQRRLDNPMDFVRLETASALKRDIPVVPVLVRGARMPRADQLPPDLGELAYRNGLELTHARWDSDVEVLVKALHRHIKDEAAATQPTSRPASATPRSAAPVNAPPAAPVTKRSSLIAVGLVAAAVVAIGLYAWMHRSPTTVSVTPPAQTRPQAADSQLSKPSEQPPSAQPAKTTASRSIRKSPEPTAPESRPVNAAARVPESVSPINTASTLAVPASAAPGAQTTSPDSSKIAANTAAPVTQGLPATTNPSSSYPPPPLATQNSTAINPNLPRFAVGHYGATAQQYCMGWLIIDAGFVRYRALQGNHGVHSFDFPFDRIKEVKKNGFMFSMNQAFHVRMADGEVFNFSQLDPKTLLFQNPDALINAVRTAVGR
jgi:TIR domain